MWFVGETEVDDLGVVGILGPEKFEQQKSCEAEFVKEIGLNEWEPKLCFWIIASLEFESVDETQKLETGTGIAGLMETGKIWDFELSLKVFELSTRETKRPNWQLWMNLRAYSY